MDSVTAHKVGGSLMVALPKGYPAKPGQMFERKVDAKGRIILDPKPFAPKRYTLKQLLATCDFSIPQGAEEREWLEAPRVGQEAI